MENYKGAAPSTHCAQAQFGASFLIMHSDSELDEIGTLEMGHSLISSLVCLDLSLVRLPSTARFARTLRCAHSLASELGETVEFFFNFEDVLNHCVMVSSFSMLLKISNFAIQSAITLSRVITRILFHHHDDDSDQRTDGSTSLSLILAYSLFMHLNSNSTQYELSTLSVFGFNSTCQK